MVDKRYGIPFVAALVLNLVYWGVVGDWFGHIKPPETPKKDLVINLDMGQQEPPQEKKDPEKLKIQPDDKPVAGGGKAGSVLPDLSGKPTEGLKNLNPYLGGNETASVNLNGNTDNPVGNPGSGNVPGPVVVMLAMVVKLMMGWAHKREILELVIRKVRATLMFLDTALA